MARPVFTDASGASVPGAPARSLRWFMSFSSTRDKRQQLTQPSDEPQPCAHVQHATAGKDGCSSHREKGPDCKAAGPKKPIPSPETRRSETSTGGAPSGKGAHRPGLTRIATVAGSRAVNSITVRRNHAFKFPRQLPTRQFASARGRCYGVRALRIKFGCSSLFSDIQGTAMSAGHLQRQT